MLGRRARTSGTAFPTRDRKPDDSQQRHVRKVVADERALLRRGCRAARECSRNPASLWPSGSCATSSTPSSRARSRTLSETRPVTIATRMPTQPQHRDAETVLDVVALELEPAAVDVAEVDATVGHHAVDVEARRAGCDRASAGSIIVAPGPRCRPRARRASSSASSGIMFGPSLGALSGSGCVSMNSPSAPAADRGERERRNELARAAARAAGALPRPLHAVRRVEDDRGVARGAHAREAAHVDDEIAVAEERSALGDGDRRTCALHGRRCRAPCRPRRAFLPDASTALSSRSPRCRSRRRRRADRSGDRGTPESGARRRPPPPARTARADGRR